MAESTENQVVANSNLNSDTQVNESQNGEATQPAEEPQRTNFWSMLKTLLIRCMFIYFISSLFRRSPTPPPTDGKAGANVPSMVSANVFPKDTVMDMYVYVNEQEWFTDFGDGQSLFWLEEELVYGDWTSGINNDGTYIKSGVLPISMKAQNNGSLHMHVFFVKAGKSPDPKDSTYSKWNTVYRSKRLNKYKKRRFHTTVNLLTGKADAHPDMIRLPNETEVHIVNCWHPNITVNIVDDHTPWVKGSIPAPLDEYIEFQPGSNKYYPVIYFNDYWNLQSEYQPINETTPVLNLTVTYTPLSMFRWQMYAAQGMRSKWYSILGEDFNTESDEEQDSLKVTFTETNPYLLGLTIVISIVHSVFEFLAFKNDIQFWRNRKSLEGLSVRSVFFNVFQSVIIVLYVLDNETNFVVKVSVFIGLAIEIWKIHKVVDVSLDYESKLFGVFPMIRIKDKSTYIESQTKQFDQLAFRYLSWLLFPLLLAYSVYSLIYQEHRGWYSWVLNLLYGFLLTFGFIMMTPQLFINYKMKSVAHLPWRMLTYKFLNTFIDDIFAFVIKMPFLYRIGCFRDDIVFLVYVYQRWIYPVDKKRINEFGTSAEMFEELDQNGVIQSPAAIEESKTIPPKSDLDKKDE